MYLPLLHSCILDQIYDNNPSVYEGKVVPDRAVSMIGGERLFQLIMACSGCFDHSVEGDFVDCGTWRGGSGIAMAATNKWHLFLAKHIGKCVGRENFDAEMIQRTVWVCDSFEGLPPPDPQYPADAKDRHYTRKELAVSLEEVQENFRRFGLLDDRVKFLKGWFKDTLPGPIEKIALLRIDGDMYGSTMDVLTALYDKVSVGGYIIVDDYKLGPCKQAVDEFREARGITGPIEIIDWTGIYWRKNG